MQLWLGAALTWCGFDLVQLWRGAALSTPLGLVYRRCNWFLCSLCLTKSVENELRSASCSFAISEIYPAVAEFCKPTGSSTWVHAPSSVTSVAWRTSGRNICGNTWRDTLPSNSTSVRTAPLPHTTRKACTVSYLVASTYLSGLCAWCFHTVGSLSALETLREFFALARTLLFTCQQVRLWLSLYRVYLLQLSKCDHAVYLLHLSKCDHAVYLLHLSECDYFMCLLHWSNVFSQSVLAVPLCKNSGSIAALTLQRKCPEPCGWQCIVFSNSHGCWHGKGHGLGVCKANNWS